MPAPSMRAWLRIKKSPGTAPPAPGMRIASVCACAGATMTTLIVKRPSKAPNILVMSPPRLFSVFTRQLERLGRIEPTVVERAPRNRALQLFRARLEQRLDVLD